MQVFTLLKSASLRWCYTIQLFAQRRCVKSWPDMLHDSTFLATFLNGSISRTQSPRIRTITTNKIAPKWGLNWSLGRCCAKNRPWPCYTNQLSQNSSFCAKSFWNHFKNSLRVAELNIARKVGNCSMLHGTQLLTQRRCAKSRAKSWIM